MIEVYLEAVPGMSVQSHRRPAQLLVNDGIFGQSGNV